MMMPAAHTLRRRVSYYKLSTLLRGTFVRLLPAPALVLLARRAACASACARASESNSACRARCCSAPACAACCC
jgi:hypothetical protein